MMPGMTPVGPGITISLLVNGWDLFLLSTSRWVGLRGICLRWIYRRSIRHYWPDGRLPQRPVYFTINAGPPTRMLAPDGSFENV